VWEGEGVKKCLYKGIPLLLEHYLLGAYYQKKAVEVTFNIDTSAEKCALPEYPVEKFALFKSNFKTKSIKPPEDFSQVIRFVSKDLQKNGLSSENLTQNQQRIVLNKLGQQIFERQKAFLPEFLSAMQEARVCLQQAESTKAANSCLAKVVALKKLLSVDGNNTITSWDDTNKSEVLDDLDDTILLLESKMKCIRGTQNIFDLSTCMK
jgi:hypothetical protein